MIAKTRPLSALLILLTSASGCGYVAGITEPERETCSGDPEVCNGKDDDCDGQIDDGDPGGGAICTTGDAGICNAGVLMCLNGTIQCMPKIVPTDEVCDGLDNDCDGLTDEDTPDSVGTCDTGLPGICGVGTLECSGGAPDCAQTQYPLPEECDNIDNDCNGNVDDKIDNVGDPCPTIGIGVCGLGELACIDGALQCKALHLPSDEICDGLDNDCNGAVDDGDPGGGAGCATGKPGVCSAGTIACAAGALTCTQNTPPMGELCDGLDNNCDGVVDDGDPGGGVACSTGKPGGCSAGTTYCSGGVIACAQNAPPSVELCDGLDNNCDGVPDDGEPEVGASCTTPLPGACAQGTVTACVAGSTICTQVNAPSIEQCASPADENCDGQAGCVGQHKFSKNFGDASTQVGRAVAVDAARNIIVAGDLQGTADFGGGPLASAGLNDIFLAKFDPALNHIWSKRFGSADNQSATSVAVDALGNVILTGTFAGVVNFGGNDLTSAGNIDIFVAKFDSSGSHLWSRRFGDSSQQNVAHVAVDSSNNILITGDLVGTIDFGCGSSNNAAGPDVFVAKLTSSGSCVWGNVIIANNAQYAGSVTVNYAGDVLITGSYFGTYTIAGNTLSNAGNGDIFVAAFAPAGSPAWSKSFGSGANDVAERIVAGPSGNIFVTGTFAEPLSFGGAALSPSGGNADIFLAKLDSAGSPIWSKSFAGSAPFDAANDLALDAAENPIIIGSTYGSVDFGLGPVSCGGNPDIIAAKLDANGATQWGTCWGDGYTQVGWGVAADSLGDVVLTGAVQGSVDFGGGAISLGLNTNAFLVKLGP